MKIKIYTWNIREDEVNAHKGGNWVEVAVTVQVSAGCLLSDTVQLKVMFFGVVGAVKWNVFAHMNIGASNELVQKVLCS